MDTEQAALGGVLDTDQHDPAIQAASAVTGLPQALSPSAEPPWPRDLAETIVSFLCPVDALALDASGTATRCVAVEKAALITHGRPPFHGPADVNPPRRWWSLPMEKLNAPRVNSPCRLHTVGIALFWCVATPEFEQSQGMFSVVRKGGRAPNHNEPWSADVMCGKEPAPHDFAYDYMEFRPRAGDEYYYWYRVGGGGRHRLFIRRLTQYRLRYR